MSNNTVTTPGADGDFWTDKQPVKTFPEAFEIKVRKFLSTHVNGENSVVGQIIWIIPDYDNLLINLMEFIQNEKSKS